LIGQIPDSELRKSIVLAYLRGKTLVDTHLLNNKLIDEHTRLVYAQTIDLDPMHQEQIRQANTEWTEYGQAVKATYLEAKRHITTALRLIEESGMLEGSLPSKHSFPLT
jgi:hypothetical protein